MNFTSIHQRLHQRILKQLKLTLQAINATKTAIKHKLRVTHKQEMSYVEEVASRNNQRKTFCCPYNILTRRADAFSEVPISFELVQMKRNQKDSCDVTLAWEDGVSCGQVSGFLPGTDHVWPEVHLEPLHWQWQALFQQQGAGKLLEDEEEKVTKPIAKGEK